MIDGKLIAVGFVFSWAVTVAGIAMLFERHQCSIFDRTLCSVTQEAAAK